jgi:hypothetical protein
LPSLNFSWHWSSTSEGLCFFPSCGTRVSRASAPASSKHKICENKYTNIIAIIKGYVFYCIFWYYGDHFFYLLEKISFFLSLSLSLFLQNSKKRKKGEEGEQYGDFGPTGVSGTARTKAHAKRRRLVGIERRRRRRLGQAHMVVVGEGTTRGRGR